MTEPPFPSNTAAESPWLGRAVWAALILAICGWTIWRMELFPLSAGSTPRAFFSVDHPFHTARADLLRHTWESLDSVRWVANHQGGYPAEFYPFGAQAIAATLTIVTFGQLATASAWAITIAIIFLLPGLAWMLAGRVDRLTPAVAVVALTGQVAIASDWTHGGFTELVEWGLATNVAGFTWALVALPLLAGAVDSASPRLAGLAALAIAMCAVTNPRALLAVALVGAAILIDAAMRREWRAPVVVLATVGVLSVGLAAPLLVPLIRHRDLYFFLSYQEYADLGAYWSATIDSVTWPVLALAGVGGAIALFRGGRAARVSAFSLVLYMSMTTMLVLFEGLRDLIPQLELPRLMPFQRFLVIWLAAYGLVEGVRLVAHVPQCFQTWRDVGVAGLSSIALIVIFATSAGPFPAIEQGMREVPRTDGQEAVELRQFEYAVALADDRTAESGAILVVGSRLSWHEQLWAPMVATERRFYYNDWLWYWHQRHAGPYDYRQGHFYPDPSQALTREYLDTHGIGAVVITDMADRSTGADARQAAANSPDLEPIDTVGAWDVYVVRDSVGLATLNGRPADAVTVSENGETIELTFEDSEPGTIRVRQNWFPSWKWTHVGMSSLPRTPNRGEDGYMEIPSEGGNVHIRLHYGITNADAIARIAAMASALGIVTLIVAARPIRRWVHR